MSRQILNQFETSIVSAILLAVALFSTGFQSGDSHGVTVARAFLQALNSGRKEAMERFIETNFSKAPDGRTLSDRADQFMALSNIGTPAALAKVLIDEPLRVVVRLTSSLDQPFELKINFRKEDPNVAAGLYLGGPGSQNHPDPKTYDSWRDLPELLSQVRSDTGVPAMTLAYVKDDSEHMAVVGARGLSAPDKATLQDRWLLGSVTKSMTATMIARLVDRGTLRWDTTVSEALPNTPMRPEYRHVTLLQLLHHQGGIVPDSYVNETFLAKAAGDSTDALKIREHYIRFVLDREPVGKPDEKMVYSNAGYGLAGHMAEALSHKPYEALMRDLVFRPLRMASAKFGTPGTAGNPGGPGELMGHSAGENGLEPYVIDDPRLVSIQCPAGAGLSMTVEDLLKFVKYHLAGLRGKATLMSQANFDVLHQAPPVRPGQQKYACGWVVEAGSQFHNGTDGTFRAEMEIWPDRNLAIVAIANAGAQYEPSAPYQALRAVFERVGR